MEESHFRMRNDMFSGMFLQLCGHQALWNILVFVPLHVGSYFWRPIEASAIVTRSFLILFAANFAQYVTHATHAPLEEEHTDGPRSFIFSKCFATFLQIEIYFTTLWGPIAFWITKTKRSPLPQSPDSVCIRILHAVQSDMLKDSQAPFYSWVILESRQIFVRSGWYQRFSLFWRVFFATNDPEAQAFDLIFSIRLTVTFQFRFFLLRYVFYFLLQSPSSNTLLFTWNILLFLQSNQNVFIFRWGQLIFPLSVKLSWRSAFAKESCTRGRSQKTVHAAICLDFQRIVRFL